MRIDLLNEYSTLVPFGFGASGRNRETHIRAAPQEAIRHEAPARRISRLARLFGSVRALGRLGSLKEFKVIRPSPAAVSQRGVEA